MSAKMLVDDKKGAKKMTNKGNAGFDLLCVAGMLALLVLILSRGAWVDDDIARRSLAKQGYSNVQILDKDWFAVGFRGCSEKDATKFEVKANNPVGEEVIVYVCVGWPFKGATIRTD